jgi:fatty-acyl-CoA synthase
MKAVILDDNGSHVRDCAVDEVGAIAISGPNVFAGYRIEAQNDGVWIDRGDGRRWLNTGDLGRQDADGYFRLTGRKKELIIRAGHNIDPAQIEQPLYTHPAVQYAAAVGRPDARVGELPVAYVQLRSGANADEAQLLEFAREKITERAAHPKAVHIIEQMPMTAVGKIFKPALARRETEAALTQALQQAGIDATVHMDTDPDQPVSIVATIPAGSDRAAAERALGAFTFPYTISSSAPVHSSTSQNSPSPGV